ncbi:MAG: hypothetical protein R2710_01845 [Acidimicrobiales bacterium]
MRIGPLEVGATVPDVGAIGQQRASRPGGGDLVFVLVLDVDVRPTARHQPWWRTVVVDIGQVEERFQMPEAGFHPRWQE